jgi:hypothetical protein
VQVHGERFRMAASWYESVPTNCSSRSTLFRMRRKAFRLLKRFEQRLKELPETMGEYDREGLAAEAVLAQEKRKTKAMGEAKSRSSGRKRPRL